MVEKSPLKYRLVRCCAFMDPAVMIQDKAPKLLSQALDIMLEAKRISASAADEVKDEFLEFCTDLKADSSDTYGLFLSFCPESSRVDKFLHTHLSTKSPKLWEFVKTLLLLSHGQASVERGFSFNKEISVENLKEHSVVAQRRVLQYIRHCGGTTEVPVIKALLTAAASGRQNYTAYSEKEKERKRCEEKKRKREEWDSELDQLKEKKKRLIREKEDLVHSTDQLARQAEDKQNFSMLTKSNAMREKNQSKMKEVAEVEAAIQAKLNELAS